MIFRANHTGGLIVALVAAVMLSGCASSVTRPDANKVSAFQPSAEFPIGRINIATNSEVEAKLKDESVNFSTEQLRSGIQQALASEQMFAASSGQGVSMDVLVTRIRIRSTFNAVMWGAMAGNDALEGDVTIKDASNKVIDKFSVSTSYALGGFAGGQGSRIDWLYEAFAKQIVGQFTPETAATSKQKNKKNRAS